MSAGRSAEIEIRNERGLHTRIATEIVKLARTFASDVEFSLDGTKADGKSVIGLLTLGARKGMRVRLSVSGSDEDRAFEALTRLLESGLPEEGK